MKARVACLIVTSGFLGGFVSNAVFRELRPTSMMKVAHAAEEVRPRASETERSARVPDVVRTRKLVLLDENGAEVATLDGGGLDFLEKEEKLTSYGRNMVTMADKKKGILSLHLNGLSIFTLESGSVSLGLPVDSFTKMFSGEPVSDHFRLTINAKDNNPLFLFDRDKEGNGALLEMYNKTGEAVIQAGTDEYGNGYVGAYNRKGKGRTLSPQ